jgi:hypothetical protein
MEDLPDQQSSVPGTGRARSAQAGQPPELRSDSVEEFAVRAAALDNGDAIKPLIGEIRARMEELVARELALRERERDLERQFRLLQGQHRQGAPPGWVESQERLRQRCAALDAQALELSARAEHLKELEARLLDREASLAQAQRELSEQADRVRHRQDTLLKLRATDRENLRQRITRIRQRERDIENRVRLAHAEIVQQREKLEQQRQQLQNQALAIERAQEALRARTTALERETAELQQRSAALDRQQRELQAQQAQVASNRAELAQTERALQQTRHELEQRARQIELDAASAAAQRGDFSRELDEICAQRTALIKEQAEHDQRLRRLTDYEEQLRARAASLETETACLAEAEAEIEARRRELDEQTQRALRDAQLQREQALALHEQAEARDAEMRQRQLAAELELEELAAQRAALERAAAESQQRLRREEDQLAQARAALSNEAAQVRAAQHTGFVRPGRWWLRTGVLAVLGACIAAVAWFSFERPVYQAAVELQLPPGAEPRFALAHEQRLRAPNLIEDLLDGDALSPAWRQLRAAGQVRIEAAADAPVIRITTRGSQPELLQPLVERAAARYAAQSSAGIESAEVAETIAQLNAERAAFEGQMRAAQQQTSRENTVATLATEEQRDQARAASDQLRRDYELRSKAFVEAQSRLVDLEKAPVRRGNVLPADYENALLADEMYQADLKEFRAALVEYRSEIRVAMLLLSDPLKNLGGALSDTAAVVAEQRGLQPPPAVAAVLEDFESKLAAFQKRLEEFAVEWEAGATQLREVDATVELTDLISRQVAAAEQARQFCGETKGLESELRARLEQFTSSSEGGTREVVVVAVLRSELAKLNARNAELTSAADNTDATRNVRLDALERQARGLQSRLERRQVSVRQLLQFEADERARVDQMEQLSALRQNVQELEEARERLIRDFTAGLDELRRLEDEVVQRRILTAEAEQAAAEIERCQSRITQIDGQIVAAQKGGLLPPVQAGGAQVRTIAGQYRTRNALLAGLGTAAAVYAVSFLTLVRNPLRRRRHWETVLKSEPTDAAN